MKLTSKQKLAVKLGRDVGSTVDNAFAASNKVTLRWPNAVIPYTIDCSLGRTFKDLIIAEDMLLLIVILTF